MNTLRQDILPPSGVEFATHLKLTPSCNGDQQQLSTRHEFVARVLCNLVVARSNLLRIFEVREEPWTPPAGAEDERERKGHVRRGTEAVEGESAMDTDGDGFINVSQGMTMKNDIVPPTRTRLYLVREHRLHGTVTGLEGVKIIASLEDKLDRLLISFKDAKIALLEWSDSVHDLVPVSIHTYERAPQLLSLTAPLFRATLRVDPLSRCAALSLPNHAIAILPFFQSQADMDVMDVVDGTSKAASSELNDLPPYSPSFILDLALQVHTSIRNVIDFTFLPGFTRPTIAVLFTSDTTQTWTGRLNEYKDTVRLIIFTLDISTQSYPIISSVEGLPYDSFTLTPCSTVFGGVLVTTSNALVYVDQGSGRLTILPVNGWAGRVSDAPLLPAPDGVDIKLEGSQTIFIDDKTLFLILKDGVIYPVEIAADGKTVTKLTLGNALAQSTVPSVASMINEGGCLFVGSMVGPSVLLKAAYVEEELTEDEEMDVASAPVVDQDADMDLYDDDDDLYGNSSAKTKGQLGDSSTSAAMDTDANVKKKKYKQVLHLSMRDSMPAYGPISSITFGLANDGDRAVPELVAATGSGPMGGFTLFQRDLPTRTKKKLLAIGGTRGLWSLPIRQGAWLSGFFARLTYNFCVQKERDTLILSTDATPSPGFSRIATRASSNSKTDVNIMMRLNGTTIGAGPFFQRTAILVVMSNSIKILEPDGTERQKIDDLDGKLARPKIRACSICDPFVLIIQEDDSIGLFLGETERGKIRRKDMSPMRDKTSKYLAGCFVTDTSGLFAKQFETTAPEAATSTLQSVVSGAGTGDRKQTQWLMLARPQGVMEIWTLPKLSLAFSTDGLPSMYNVLTDSHAKPALSSVSPQDPPRKPQEFDIEQVLVTDIGETNPAPHLCVFLRSGQLTVYKILPSANAPGVTHDTKMANATLSPAATTVSKADTKGKQPGKADDTAAARRAQTLNIKFVKMSSMAFEIHRPEEGESGEPKVLAEVKRVHRTFVPFVTHLRTSTPSGAGGVEQTTYSGVFFTGDRPNWILGTDKGGIQIFPSAGSTEWIHRVARISLQKQSSGPGCGSKVARFSKWPAANLSLRPFLPPT
ncbi:hypothetical protein BKA70DRAFT_1191418 [Coprinopsis sp. MPI-PUGE-AT-0042]|nr:hypothetical protein BKA70DRAFT_1191418 [Coprinopsis sp. MPI-PUGE-AT-0042]